HQEITDVPHVESPTGEVHYLVADPDVEDPSHIPVADRPGEAAVIPLVVVELRDPKRVGVLDAQWKTILRLERPALPADDILAAIGRSRASPYGWLPDGHSVDAIGAGRRFGPLGLLNDPQGLGLALEGGLGDRQHESPIGEAQVERRDQQDQQAGRASAPG